MYIPCETCFSRYKREYSKECDTFCDYARATKENREYQKSEVLNTQIRNIDALINRLEVCVNAVNRIGVDALNKMSEQNIDIDIIDKFNNVPEVYPIRAEDLKKILERSNNENKDKVEKS